MNLRNQAIINSSGNIAYFLALWLLTIITTKTLGYDAAGALTLAMAVGNVISTVQVFGVRGYQSSDVLFKYSSKAYLAARVATVAVGLAFGLTFCMVMRYPTQITCSVILFILLKTSETFSDVLFGNDQRAGRLELAGFSMLARGILLTAAFTAGTVCFKSLNKALLAASAAVLSLSLFVDLPLHNRTVRNEKNRSSANASGILRECFPLLVTTLIPTVITAFPRIVLERYYGAATLGYYGNVSTPALLLTTVAPTILIALLPVYGRLAEEKNFKKIRSIWLKSLAVAAGAAAMAMLGVFLLGKQVLSIVYTSEIMPYVPYLYPVILAMMLYSITMCCNTVLVPLRKSWGLTLTTVLALVICMIISIPAVRSFGIVGAAASLAVPYLAQVIVQTIWILAICKKGEKA